MFDRSSVGCPGPSLIECLIVFTALFGAGSLWAACVRCYVEYCVEEQAHA